MEQVPALPQLRTVTTLHAWVSVDDPDLPSMIVRERVSRWLKAVSSPENVQNAAAASKRLLLTPTFIHSFTSSAEGSHRRR
jgi:hypothetical protein